MVTEKIIKILETEYEWNKKNNDGFSETQKMLIADTVKIVNGQPKEPIDFVRLAELAIEWLNNNYNPHTRIIIDCNTAEVVEGIKVHTTDKFIKD